MKKLIFLLLVLLSCSTSLAAEQIVVFEENNSAWTYSGYWRNSNQGQYGSGSNYAVGNASSSNSNSYSGDSGEGVAMLDLAAFSDKSMTIELCYVEHGNQWRDGQNTLTIHTQEDDIELIFSQLGNTNAQNCIQTNTYAGVSSLSLSNATPNDKWVTLDYVRISIEETSPPSSDGYKSSYTDNDIVPQSELKTSDNGERVIDADLLGISPDSGTEFARAFAVLDDIDENGVNELFISASYTSPVSKTPAHGVIVFLDNNRNILKVQHFDEALLFGAGYSSGFSVRYAHKTGDFDGNGVSDIILSENAGKSGRFRTVLFGKNDSVDDPYYTVVDVVDHANSTGNLPFVLTSNAVFGSDTQPYPDTDNNGVMGYFTRISDVNGDLRASQGLSTTQNYFVFVQPGKTAQSLSQVTFSPASVTSGGEMVGDMNGDGFPDIVTPIANGRDWGILSHISQGNIGQFAPVAALTQVDGVPFAAINYLKAGDANNDGFIDVLLGGTLTVNGRPDPSVNNMLVLFYLDENYQQLGEPSILVRNTDYDRDTEMWRTIRTGSIRVFDLDNDGASEIILANPHSKTNPALHIRYFQ